VYGFLEGVRAFPSETAGEHRGTCSGAQLIDKEFRLVARERKIILFAKLANDETGHLVAAVKSASVRYGTEYAPIAVSCGAVT